MTQLASCLYRHTVVLDTIFFWPLTWMVDGLLDKLISWLQMGLWASLLVSCLAARFFGFDDPSSDLIWIHAAWRDGTPGEKIVFVKVLL